MISSRASRCSIKPPHSCRSARLPGHQLIWLAAGWHQFCILMLSAKGSLCRLLMYSVSPDWTANGAKKYIKNEQSTHLNCTHFNSQYYPWITHKGHENKVTDRQLKKLLIEIRRSSQLRTLLKLVVVNRTWKKFRSYLQLLVSVVFLAARIF